EYTANMIEAGQRLVSLVNDILDLSTIEAGYMKLYPQEMDVRTVVGQVVDLTQDWARKQKIEMHVECPSGIKLFADERRIKQVLRSLISSAIQYAPRGGSLAGAAGLVGDGCQTSVQDTGMGTAAEHLARVCARFERIRGRKTNLRGGAGLGLSLVKS